MISCESPALHLLHATGLLGLFTVFD